MENLETPTPVTDQGCTMAQLQERLDCNSAVDGVKAKELILGLLAEQHITLRELLALMKAEEVAYLAVIDALEDYLVPWIWMTEWLCFRGEAEYAIEVNGRRKLWCLAEAMQVTAMEQLIDELVKKVGSMKIVAEGEMDPQDCSYLF